MSKSHETSSRSSSGCCSHNSPSQSSEEISDIFRLRIHSLNQDSGKPKETPRSGHHHYHNQYNCSADDSSTVIRDVWENNLYEEFQVIRQLLPRYKYIAMDTEFPGVVIFTDKKNDQQSHFHTPNCRNTGEYQFEMIRNNVDALKLIQLGISFFSENGVPENGISTFQFNFKFNIMTDRNAIESIGLLIESGLQFDRHQSEGIDPDTFCELLITSGLVLNDEICWLTYHGGYDFGYLMRILIGCDLPLDGDEFIRKMKIFFPRCFDVKVMLADCTNMRGGLQDVASQLALKRIGTQHQAGSDSLLTGMTFFSIKKRFFDDDFDEEKYNGRIYGLSSLSSGDEHTRQHKQLNINGNSNSGHSSIM